MLSLGYLVPSQLDGDGHVDGVVDHAHHRPDQRNEQKRKPNDADQEENDQSSHPIFDYFLLLLSFRLWVFLPRVQINQDYNIL